MRRSFVLAGALFTMLLTNCGGGGGGENVYYGVPKETLNIKGYVVDEPVNGTVTVNIFEANPYDDLPNKLGTATVEVRNGEFNTSIEVEKSPYGYEVEVCVENGSDGVNQITLNDGFCGIYDYEPNKSLLLTPVHAFVYRYKDYLSSLPQPFPERLNQFKQQYWQEYANSLNEAVQYVENVKQILGIQGGKLLEWRVKLALALGFDVPRERGGTGYISSPLVSIDYLNSQMQITDSVPQRNYATVNYYCYGNPDAQNNLCSMDAYLNGEFAVKLEENELKFYVKDPITQNYIPIGSVGLYYLLKEQGLPCELPNGNGVYYDEINSYVVNCDFTKFYDGQLTCTLALKLGNNFIIPSDLTLPQCDAKYQNLTGNEYIYGNVTFEVKPF